VKFPLSKSNLIISFPIVSNPEKAGKESNNPNCNPLPASVDNVLYSFLSAYLERDGSNTVAIETIKIPSTSSMSLSV
jgi:hypothetical protein